MTLAGGFAAAMIALLAGTQASPPSPKLDKVVDGAAAGGFAGEVLVTDGQGVTYARTVSAPGRPHRRGELWRWASVTKQLTATLVLQAVSEGRLSLDDTLAARLPGFHGATADRVTLRMLLQHTSGLPNPNDTPAASARDLPGFYRRTTPGVGGAADALGYCAGPPRAEPGAGFSYDNCDYIVLERAWGRPFATLLRERIARPAGLRTLAMANAAAATPRLVPGFAEDGSPEPPLVLASFGPAGAGYGTADDLAAFDRALMGGRLLDPAALVTAWTGDPRLGYVALGTWSYPAPLQACGGSVWLIERRGEIGGIEVRNLIAPDRKRALVVFADRADVAFGELWQGRGLGYDLAEAAFC